MEKIGRIVLAMVLLGLVSAASLAQAYAQTPVPAPPSPVTLTLSAEQLGVIWAGLQELPGRVADPVKKEVLRQMEQTMATKAKPDEKPAEKK